MKTPRFWLLLALVAVLAVAATACGGDDDDDDDGAAAPETTDGDTGMAMVDCTASIGIMGPFTGDVAAIGQEQLNWAKFAVDTFNEEHGTTFELVEGDTQLDPAQASVVAPQFVDNDAIVAVVGPAGSQDVDAVGGIYADASMAFISPSATATNLTEDYETFYRVVPTDADQGPTDATYMVEELGAQNVLIIDDQSSYSTGLADSTTAALEDGGATVTRESVSQDQTDFSSLVSAVADDTDVVFLPWQVAANAQLFGNQLAEQGKDVVIFGSDGLFSPEDFKIAGSYVSSFAPDIHLRGDHRGDGGGHGDLRGRRGADPRGGARADGSDRSARVDPGPADRLHGERRHPGCDVLHLPGAGRRELPARRIAESGTGSAAPHPGPHC